MPETNMPDLQPELTLDPDTAFFILLKTREFDAKEEEVDPDEGSNPSDDKDVDVLEFQPDDAVEEEVTRAIEGLNEDQRLDLIALAWIGRGDFTLDDWAEARESAREVDANQVAQYLLEMPTVSDYLEESLSQLGYSLNDYLESGLRTPVAPEAGLDTD
jgi:hypothetical protein